LLPGCAPTKLAGQTTTQLRRTSPVEILTSAQAIADLLQPVFVANYAWALLGEAVWAAQMLSGLVVLAGIQLAKHGS